MSDENHVFVTSLTVNIIVLFMVCNITIFTDIGCEIKVGKVDK